jgi:hypothetical protein
VTVTSTRKIKKIKRSKKVSAFFDIFGKIGMTIETKVYKPILVYKLD